MADDGSPGGDVNASNSNGNSAGASAASIIQTALNALAAGPEHPAYSDPVVRPWIDLIGSSGTDRTADGQQLLARNNGAGSGSSRFGNAPQPTTQQQAVNFAQSHLGDGLWSSYGMMGSNDEVGGQDGRLLHGVGAPKCNFLVHDAYESAGAAPSLPDGSIPRTADWFKPGTKIVSNDGRSFEVVQQAEDGLLDQSQLQPGDIITNGHHMGIYAPGPDGQTISAATPNPNNFLPGDRDHPWMGGVTRNDWAFRKGNGDHIVVRRLTPR